MRFATSRLSGLSNAGKPKHSFVIAVWRSKALTRSPRPNKHRHLKILASGIRRELEVQTERIGHCALYEDELQRIWPLNEENRKAKIAQFAKEYGFKLSFYKTRAMRHLGERTVAHAAMK
jgi:hypothetical protein